MEKLKRKLLKEELIKELNLIVQLRILHFLYQSKAMSLLKQKLEV